MGQRRNQKRNKKLYHNKENWKYNLSNLMRCRKSNSESKVYSSKFKLRNKKISNKNPIFIPQETRKRTIYGQG